MKIWLYKPIRARKCFGKVYTDFHPCKDRLTVYIFGLILQIDWRKMHHETI